MSLATHASSTTLPPGAHRVVSLPSVKPAVAGLMSRLSIVTEKLQLSAWSDLRPAWPSDS